MMVYTIGHSNSPLIRFLDLLTRHDIAVLIDARSQPYSRFSPHFNRTPLSTSLAHVGIIYRYLGDRLGGRPKDPQYRLPNGDVDYARLAAAPMYHEGMRQLWQEAAMRRVAIMCSEADYRRCHRYWLITHSLMCKGVTVHHILQSGDTECSLPEDFAAADQLPLL
jgi:uncharacterized protein (DUF488 family)